MSKLNNTGLPLNLYESDCTRCSVVFFSSDAGVHDRVVIMELLKEVAQSHSLDTTHKDFKGNLNTYYLK